MSKYLRINTLEEIVQINDEEKDLILHIEFSSYPLNIVETLFENIKKLHENGYSLNVVIEAEDRNFNDEEIMAFSSLESLLLSIHVPLHFDGGYREEYTLEELIKTDVVLDKIIDRINKASLSPLEKFFSVYRYLIKRKYHAEQRDDDHPDYELDYLSRDIISVMNSDYIVCEGYANLMYYLLENVGVTCFKQALTANEKHMNNLVYIEDDKYQVKGLYYADSCWDVTDYTVNFCLLPLSDVAKIKVNIVVDSNSLPFYRVRNFKLLCDDVFISHRMDSFFEYEQIIKRTNLEKEADNFYLKGIDLFIKNKKEMAACLAELFKKLDIDSEFYISHNDLPYGTSLPFLAAMLLLSKDNISLVEHQISEAKRYTELELDRMSFQERPYFKGDIIMDRFFVGDVYGFLKAVEDFPYEVHGSSVTAIDSLLNTDALVFEAPCAVSFCLETALFVQRALTLDRLEKVLDEKYPLGKPIEIDIYRKALKESFKSDEEYNEEEANKEVEGLISRSLIHAKNVFEEADNCFYKEQSPCLNIPPLDKKLSTSASDINELFKKYNKK